MDARNAFGSQWSTISQHASLGSRLAADANRLAHAARLVVLPFLNSDLAAHPAFEQSVQRLRAWGVTVLYGPGGFQPHAAGAAGQRVAEFPWSLAVATTRELSAAAKRS